MPYTCPRCGRTSHHPEDERWRYCGACHRFEDDGAPAGAAFPRPEHLAARLAAAEPVRQQLPAEVAFYVLAYLQLALRHPSALSESGMVVRAAAEQLEAALRERVPEAAALLAAGWDPQQDA